MFKYQATTLENEMKDYRRFSRNFESFNVNKRLCFYCAVRKFISNIILTQFLNKTNIKLLYMKILLIFLFVNIIVFILLLDK